MNWLSFILKLLPGIIQTVVAVEGAVSGAAKGATKKQIVMTAIQAGATAAESIPEQHIQLVSTLVDNVVSSFNKAGIFQTTSSAK